MDGRYGARSELGLRNRGQDTEVDMHVKPDVPAAGATPPAPTLTLPTYAPVWHAVAVAAAPPAVRLNASHGLPPTSAPFTVTAAACAHSSASDSRRSAARGAIARGELRAWWAGRQA